MGFTKRSVFRVDCRRDPQRSCEQLRDAYESLENRFGEAINEEGQITSNLPPDTAIGTPGGDVNLTDVAMSYFEENPEEWEEIAEIQVDTGPIVDPEAIGMTPSGDILITAQDAVSSGTVEFWQAQEYIVDPQSYGSVSSAELDLPDPLMVVNPDGRFVFVLGLATGRKLSLIDFSNPTQPEIVSSLDITSQLQNGWTDAKWDAKNRILWVVDGSTTDTVWGISVDLGGNLEVAIQFTDTTNMNRPKSLNLSDSGETLYVGQRGRVASLDISDLTSISIVTTVSMPSGSEDVFNMAREYGRIAFTTNTTTPATVYGMEVDPDDEQVITLKGSVQIPDGDATQRNMGATMNGSIFTFVTRPEGFTAKITLVKMLNLDAPAVIEQLDTEQGGAVARYFTPASHIWLQYFRPAGVQTWISTYRGGKSSVEDVGDPDTAYQGYSANSAYFRAWVQNGKAPFETVSKTVNTNFNADLLDGLHANQIVDIAVSEATNTWLFWERINGA